MLACAPFKYSVVAITYSSYRNLCIKVAVGLFKAVHFNQSSSLLVSYIKFSFYKSVIY